MQFKVPQFLEIEDKIFGPFTFSQFAYLAGGAGLCFVLFKFLGFLLGLIPILAVAGLSFALTFYRPNDKPLMNMLEAGLKYAIQDKLYIWKRKKLNKQTKKTTTENASQAQGDIPRLTNSRLRDLAWSLDVLDLQKEEQ